MESKLLNNIDSLSAALESKKDFDLHMTIGLDGFVDEIVHVVDKRQDFDTFSRVLTIEALGQRIVNAAGLSANIEFVTTHTKLGGNGPIFANSLLEYGAGLTYIGALGDPSIHPVFNSMAENSEAVYSLCDPGHTDALEFDDGKLMLGKITAINRITWARFKEVVGDPKTIAAMIDKCHLFGMENWTMVPHMSEVWKGLIDEVFPLLADRAEKPYAFFDLADPEKRTKEDILEAMKLIGKFEQKFKAVLGLNEKELYQIADVMGVTLDRSLDDAELLKKTIQDTYEKLGIYCLVVHPTKEAACCIGGDYYQTDGPFCEKPVLTTGAGDNFNAGFCLGQALGLDPQSSLVLGVSTSGYYVRNGKSPRYDDVIAFLKDWKEGKLS